MMYGGKYMKSKNKDAKSAADAETAKYQAYGCAGPSTTLTDILATYKKK
jgi:hypothetical protein